MKNGRNLRQLILFSLAAGCTLGGLGGGDTWYSFGIGGKVSLTDNTVFYGDVEKSFGGDVTTKWQFNVGLRFLW